MRNSDKKEWAKLLFTKEHMSQKEIAEKVGVSKVTINKWAKSGQWDLLKQSILLTKDQQLRRLYAQFEELNTAISTRDEGKRFADSKEADTLLKLTNTIKNLESEASISDIVNVSKRLLDWLRRINPAKAKEIAQLFDDFIKEQLKS